MGAKLRCALHQLSTDSLISSSQHAFDAYGDFVLHRGRPASTDPPLPMGWPDELGSGFDHALAQLDEFGRHCARVRARCVFSFPPLRREAFDAGKATIAEIERRLSTEQRLPIVQAAEDMVYPAMSFHDPGQHLTEKAAVDRTLRLLDALGVSR